MQQSITTKQKDILNTQNSTEENHTNNSNSNYERIPLQNTPFWAIGDAENGYNLIMGKWKLTTESYKTIELLDEWMFKNRWNIILSMIICATQDIQNQQKEQQDHDDVPTIITT